MIQFRGIWCLHIKNTILFAPELNKPLCLQESKLFGVFLESFKITWFIRQTSTTYLQFLVKVIPLTITAKSTVSPGTEKEKRILVKLSNCLKRNSNNDKFGGKDEGLMRKKPKKPKTTVQVQSTTKWKGYGSISNDKYNRKWFPAFPFHKSPNTFLQYHNHR